MLLASPSALVLTALAALPLLLSNSADEFDDTHGAWTQVLKSYADDGLVDYAGLKRAPAELNAYLQSLEDVDPLEFASWKRAEKYAFWINAYNAYTIQLVVQNYPISSITKIKAEGQIWDRPFIPLKSLFPEAKAKRLSLNDIEHQILRPEFRDARVHAAINCASISCPPLRSSAFTPKGLEQQLDEVTSAWLADPAKNQFNIDARKARISRVFEWFEGDFVRDAGSLPKWLALYAPTKDRTWLRSGPVALEYADYDWGLNVLIKAPAVEEEAGKKNRD
jgi:hypothetical protein